MTKKNMKWVWILVLVIVVLGLLYYMPTEIQEPVGTDPVTDIDDEFDTVNQEIEMCVESGGYWNECGSACAGEVVDFCIEVCVAQCECGFNDYVCPEGYECYQEPGAERGVCRVV